jgi:predicted outer membrane repeat protein
MWLHELWQRCLGQPATSQPRSAPRRGCKLRLEQLECRTVPTSYTAASVAELIADINAANKHGASNTITLAANTTFDLTTVDNQTDGATGLPVIKNGDNLTIVGNGDVIERSNAGGTPYRLLDVASTASLTLVNLTLQNGVAFDTGGGAIYNQGTLVLNGVIVRDNRAEGRYNAKNDGGDGAGGGIWSSGALTLENASRVENNQALGGFGGNKVTLVCTPLGCYYENVYSGGNGRGGGIYVASGTVNLTSASVSSNTAQGGSPIFSVSGGSTRGLGGGLYVAAGAVNLTSATVQYNTATSDGGGLYVAGGTVSLDGTTVAYNAASSYGGFGGGLYVGPAAAVSLRNDTVEYNTASYQGGGLFMEAGATVYLDQFTLAHTINNTGNGGLPDNIAGSYTLL